MYFYLRKHLSLRQFQRKKNILLNHGNWSRILIENIAFGVAVLVVRYRKIEGQKGHKTLERAQTVISNDLQIVRTILSRSDKNNSN